MVAAAVALVVVAIVIGEIAGGMNQSPTAPRRANIQWRCRTVPIVPSAKLYAPSAQIRNIGGQPMHVFSVNVAYFGPDGGEVSSVRLNGPQADNIIAPGATVMFNGGVDQSLTAGDSCRVTKIS